MEFVNMAYAHTARGKRTGPRQCRDPVGVRFVAHCGLGRLHAAVGTARRGSHRITAVGGIALRVAVDGVEERRDVMLVVEFVLGVPGSHGGARDIAGDVSGIRVDGVQEAGDARLIVISVVGVGSGRVGIVDGVIAIDRVHQRRHISVIGDFAVRVSSHRGLRAEREGETENEGEAFSGE